MSAKKRAEPDDRPYDIGQWNGLPRYQCRLCQFDTLDEDAIKRHLEDRHWPRPVTQPVAVPLYDRFGNLISEREVT